jgi:ribonuclease P protein component
MTTMLTRDERIRQRPDFLRIQQQGVRVRGRYLTLVGRRNARTVSRLGVIAPKRLGKAVDRNRVKRRIRELFRHNKPTIDVDLVVMPLRAFLKTRFTSLQDDYRRALHRQLRSLGSR